MHKVMHITIGEYNHIPGTIPTLVVPLEKTLAPEDDHRYKALTDTKVARLLRISKSVFYF